MLSYTTSEAIPESTAIGYHAAPTDALSPIQNEGLRPDISTDETWQSVNEWLGQYAAQCEGVPPLPVDRNHCVYMFDDPSTPITWVDASETHMLVVVDRAATEGTYYCGEMGLVTTMIDNVASDETLPERAFEQAQKGTVTDGSKEAGFLRLARQYVSSVTRLPDENAAVPLDVHDVEVFTPSRIPPDAIQGIWIPNEESPQQV